MRAWVYQQSKAKKVGAEKESFYVGWIDPDGKRRCKSCGPGTRGQKAAERLARKIEGQLLAGTYQGQSKMTWKQFRQDYEGKVLLGLAIKTQHSANTSLDHFEKIVRPIKMTVIDTRTIDQFIANRRKSRGRKAGSMLSPASVNHDLRHLKAALRVAVEWGYLPRMPKFRMEKEPKRLPTYVTGGHFAMVYRACDQARFPDEMPFTPADWWRGLLVMGYMTGWRISDLLGLRRADLDLDAGTAITRASDNKGKRDEQIKLHPVVVEHLRNLANFDSHIFPWNHDQRTLHTEFAKLQEGAGIHLPCAEDHEHTRFCHVYGFHDLRRAFATMNADKLTPDALQALMRHKSYQTTQRYINMARQMDAAVAGLYVPEVLKRKARMTESCGLLRVL